MALLNVVIFIFLCMLHFYWLFGGRWGMDFAVPTKEKSTDKLFKPSAISTLVVAVGFLCFAFVAIGDTGIFSDWIELVYFKWGNLFIAIVFLVRTVGDFKYVGFFKKIRETAFAKNDSLYYSPLCLLIAITSSLVAFT